MEKYKNNLNNIGLVGHSGAGKTSLVEALLYSSKLIDRLGKIEDGTTNSDYDIEEKKRKISVNTSILQLNLEENKINLLDTPGYFDFAGEVIKGMRAADSALIVVSGVNGVEVGTEKVWKYCVEKSIPKVFFVNKLDKENSEYENVLEKLKNTFGNNVVPLNYPLGKGEKFNKVVDIFLNEDFNEKIDISTLNKIEKYREEIIELIAESDEELLNKYLEDGKLDNEDIYTGLISCISSGDIVPVLCGSATKCLGVESLLHYMNKILPACNLISNEVENKKNEKEDFSAVVFKTIVDPFVGKLSIFKVLSGELTNSMDILNTSTGEVEKVNNLYYINGKNQIPTTKIKKGDIGAISKIQNLSTGDIIGNLNLKAESSNMEFPKPVITMAIIPNSKADESKVSIGLSKLLEEDNTFKIVKDVENAETLISGMGEVHLEVLVNRLKNKFGINVNLRMPKIPYKETIKGTIDIQGKHKKQSGGHGQYGDVKIKFEPRMDGKEELEFVDAVVGGVVPRNFIPAVEKGLKECIKHGVLAGYPVIGLKATLHDGSYHPVDSSEMAFKIAATMAYKKGLEGADPIILEPIMDMEVNVPEQYMGEVINDINKKRGKIIGIKPNNEMQIIVAEVPLAESFKYATDLRSITQERGSFTMKFKKYSEVPSTEIDNIIKNKEK